MVVGLETRIGLPPVDEARWQALGALQPIEKQSGRVYELLELSGCRTAIVGPFWLPNDSLSLQLTQAVGSHGLVYSIDPQGSRIPRKSNGPWACGAGNSVRCKAQIDALRNAGVSLGQFEWLGPESSIEYIPDRAQSLDCIVDHGVLEFLGQFAERGYIDHGAQEIIQSLRVGGIWVHHGDSDSSSDLLGISPVQWLVSQGMRVKTCQIEEDSYSIPVDIRVLPKVDKLMSRGRLFKQIGLPVLFDYEHGAIIIPERKIHWPRHYVIVAQKLHQ
jgi:hypothetical protein